MVGARRAAMFLRAQGRNAVGRNSSSRIAPGLGDIPALVTPFRRTERLQAKRRNTPEGGYCALRPAANSTTHSHIDTAA